MLIKQLTTLYNQAQAGEPVYIHTLQQLFDSDAENSTVVFRLELTTDSYKDFTFQVPLVDSLPQHLQRWVFEYIYAKLYNILSTYGGKSVTCFFDTCSAALVECFDSMEKLFGVGVHKKERTGYGRVLNVSERMTDALENLPVGTSKFSCMQKDFSEYNVLSQAVSAGSGAPATGQASQSATSAAQPTAQTSAISETTSQPEHSAQREPSTQPLLQRLQQLPAHTKGKAILGVDVGGSDIKVALSLDGTLVACKEYDWFPAQFSETKQLIDPIVLMARWGQLRLTAEKEFPQYIGELETLCDASIADDVLMAEIDRIEAAMVMGGEDCGECETTHANTVRLNTTPEEPRSKLYTFDAIGLCFPDVVVQNKIVGGEVYKTRGIRNNPEVEYESDFAQLTDLHMVLQQFCKPHGMVQMVNDGPMAAFTAAVEIACSGDSAVNHGVFAHTLGTELGTGLMLPDGTLPDIPLEVYNYIIDVGSKQEAQFEADDPRSINNFNTGLPGTLQKYTSQSGVFRLALKYFATEAPGLYKDLFQRGFYVQKKSDEIYIPDTPEDKRKPLLEYLMALPDTVIAGNNVAVGARGVREIEGSSESPVMFWQGHLTVQAEQAIERIFTDIGEYVAATWLETEWVLDTQMNQRVLFGRLVKRDSCFQLMCQGARDLVRVYCTDGKDCATSSIMPTTDDALTLVVADSTLAHSALMKELEAHPHFTVAQFAQAIGAVYYGIWKG